MSRPLVHRREGHAAARLITVLALGFVLAEALTRVLLDEQLLLALGVLP